MQNAYNLALFFISLLLFLFSSFVCSSSSTQSTHICHVVTAAASRRCLPFLVIPLSVSFHLLRFCSRFNKIVISRRYHHTLKGRCGIGLWPADSEREKWPSAKHETRTNKKKTYTNRETMENMRKNSDKQQSPFGRDNILPHFAFLKNSSSTFARLSAVALRQRRREKTFFFFFVPIININLLAGMALALNCGRWASASVCVWELGNQNIARYAVLALCVCARAQSANF